MTGIHQNRGGRCCHSPLQPDEAQGFSVSAHVYYCILLYTFRQIEKQRHAGAQLRYILESWPTGMMSMGPLGKMNIHLRLASVLVVGFYTLGFIGSPLHGFTVWIFGLWPCAETFDLHRQQDFGTWNSRQNQACETVYVSSPL